MLFRSWRIGRRVKNDPKRLDYTDLALAPVFDEDLGKLALFAETAGGEAALSKRRGEDIARARVTAARNQRLAAAE